MYNLLDEKWIPVLWTDGIYSRVGIKKALTEAHKIRQIAASNPMDRVAVLRFLLALLYWCQGNPPDSSGVPAGSFPPEWFSKLDENKDYFELFGEGKRFYQYRGKDNKKLTANYLIHEIPTGTNLWHFRHSQDGSDGLCRACCALGLLRLPLFTTQGGRGKSPGINAKPPVYIVLVGNTLFEALRLSWQPKEKNVDMSIPAWEEPEIKLPATGKVPLLTGLTWLPRRVWLDEPSHPEAPCISCGRSEMLIRCAIFHGLGSTKTDSGQTREWLDPHVAHVQIKKKQGAINIPLYAAEALSSPDAASGQWARLVEYNQQEKELAVGFATDQNKYFEAWGYEIPPSSKESNGMFEQWKKEGDGLANKVPKRQGRGGKHTEFKSALAAIRPHVESKVSNRLSQLLNGEDEAWQKAASEYKPMMEAMAGSLAPGYTTSALQKRQQISETLPDMKPTNTGKPQAKKKGDKK